MCYKSVSHGLRINCCGFVKASRSPVAGCWPPCLILFRFLRLDRLAFFGSYSPETFLRIIRFFLKVTENVKFYFLFPSHLVFEIFILNLIMSFGSFILRNCLLRFCDWVGEFLRRLFADELVGTGFDGLVERLLLQIVCL